MGMSTGSLRNSGSLTTSRPVAVDFADDRKRAALAVGDLSKHRNRSGVDGENVTLLRFVAPDFHRRHAGFGARNGSQVDPGAAVTVRDGFRYGVGQTARAHVVNQHDRILGAERPTGVDHFLRTPLDLGVTALHRGKIQIGAGGAAADRRSGAAAQSDEHGRSAQHDELRADRHLALLNIRAANVAQAAGDHDGLVIAAHAPGIFTLHMLLECSEITADRRTAELVVERGGADRPFDHDVERRGDALRLADCHNSPADSHGRSYPGMRRLETEKPVRPAFGLAPRPVAPSSRISPPEPVAAPGKGRNGGGMIVRLDLHENVDGLIHGAVDAGVRIREITCAARSLDDGGVVAIGGEHAVGIARVRVADHREQRLVALAAVDDPVGIEDLVAAMLGVGLRKHHQLDVGRLAPERPEVA